MTEVLLVDDHSIDANLEVASQLAIRTLALPHNVGYGGNERPVTSKLFVSARASSSCFTPTASTTPRLSRYNPTAVGR